MYRINFAMEDSLRDMMYRMVGDYTKMMQQFCPDSVEVFSNDNVVVRGMYVCMYACIQMRKDENVMYVFMYGNRPCLLILKFHVRMYIWINK